MAEPEELILEGAHFATRVARDAWRRYAAADARHEVSLSLVRVRLELFLTALFEQPIAIAPMESPAPAGWLSRLARGRWRDRPDLRLLSGTDGHRVYLPPVLPSSTQELAARGESPAAFDAPTLYRLLAVQQAARLTRGTAAVFARIDDGAVQAWFRLAEAAAIDRWVATDVPGLVPALNAARQHALAGWDQRARPRLDAAFDRHLRVLLAADSSTTPPMGTGGSPEESRRWAREQAEGHETSSHPRVTLPWYWGEILPPIQPMRSGTPSGVSEPASRPSTSRVAEMRRRPRAREAADDEDDANAGTWVIRADEPQESVEDPFGLQRPADADDSADPEGLGDSLSELPEARVVSTPGQAREVLRSGEPIGRAAAPEPVTRVPSGLVYPEWDYRVRAYRRAGAVVRQPPPALGEAAWVDAVKVRHARLARRVRSRFERLRPRPISINRQLNGDEPDLAAWVDVCADIRAGGTVDDRVYVERRPARRELAVALLADVSASTDGWVDGTRRIVDVEKDALLVVCEALDALGDRYAIFAFSGEGADDVSVLPLKRFEERRGGVVERRIAALDADRYTRMGAAIRHVTAALGRERPTRRLLLILSDGKPNDVDLYEGRYGVDDTRQAVAEARRQGVAVFCLTVDREAPRYAGRIFGPAGFAVLRRAEELPVVLIDVLRQLVRG